MSMAENTPSASKIHQVFLRPSTKASVIDLYRQLIHSSAFVAPGIERLLESNPALLDKLGDAVTVKDMRKTAEIAAGTLVEAALATDDHARLAAIEAQLDAHLAAVRSLRTNTAPTPHRM